MDCVQKLRVSELATDQEIQNALHQLFHSSPQGNFVEDLRRSIIGATAGSKI